MRTIQVSKAKMIELLKEQNKVKPQDAKQFGYDWLNVLAWRTQMKLTKVEAGEVVEYIWQDAEVLKPHQLTRATNMTDGLSI